MSSTIQNLECWRAASYGYASSAYFQTFKDDILGMQQFFDTAPTKKDRHKCEYPFVDNVKIFYNGFEAMSHELVKNGWEIVVEKNLYTGKFKLVFRNQDGLMCRMDYFPEHPNGYFILPLLTAVKNYRIKAKKITELESIIDWVTIITNEDIPLLVEKIKEFGIEENQVGNLLEVIREAQKDSQVEIVVDKMKKSAKLDKEKLVKLADYIKYKQAA